MKKYKSIVIIVIVLIILSICGVMGIKKYKQNEYNKQLEQMKAGYNDEQKDCVPIGLTNNYIYVLRKDKDNNAVKGSKWKITDYDGKEVAIVETNEVGACGIVGIEYGTYYLEEISVPDGVIRDEYKYDVVISPIDTKFKLTQTDSEHTGSILIVLRDENDDPVNGVSYEIYNSSNEKILTVTTNAKGLAGGENLEDGLYYIKQQDNPQNQYHVFIQNSTIQRLDITYIRELV